MEIALLQTKVCFCARHNIDSFIFTTRNCPFHYGNPMDLKLRVVVFSC